MKINSDGSSLVEHPKVTLPPISNPKIPDQSPQTTGIANYIRTKLSEAQVELDKKLQKRSDRTELVSRNILKEEPKTGVSAAILQTKIALEKEKFQDKLAARIQRRPSKTDLENRNILRNERGEIETPPLTKPSSNDSLTSSSSDESNLSNDAEANAVKQVTDRILNFSTAIPERAPSPAIDSRNKPFQQRQQQLRSILKARPERNNLEERNILKHENIDPALQAATERLKRAQLTDNLESRLANRPTADQLSHLLNFNETVEILPTWRATDYCRKPDNDATFKKLTPKLKMEIREELNSYKKEEMAVHELSHQNTAFH